MKKEEFELLVKKMRDELKFSDEHILQTLIKVFEDGECNLEDLKLMVNWLGYNLTEEFYKDHGINKENKEYEIN